MILGRVSSLSTLLSSLRLGMLLGSGLLIRYGIWKVFIFV